MRWLALATGALLVGVAFVAASRVADTREGLVFEVITLLAGAAGVALVLYGWFSQRRAYRSSGESDSPISPAQGSQVRTANDLLLGGGGIVLAGILVGGLAYSGGTAWGLLGLVLLLPMVIGCGYLCFAFIRGPNRAWRIDLQRLTRRRS